MNQGFLTPTFSSTFFLLRWLTMVGLLPQWKLTRWVGECVPVRFCGHQQGGFCSIINVDNLAIYWKILCSVLYERDCLTSFIGEKKQACYLITKLMLGFISWKIGKYWIKYSLYWSALVLWVRTQFCHGLFKTKTRCFPVPLQFRQRFKWKYIKLLICSLAQTQAPF